jgi:hypothetical protein
MNIPTFPFLSGKFNQFALIPIEGFNQRLADGVFEYVAKHGFCLNQTDRKIPVVVPRMKPPQDEKTYSIQFRSLFIDSVDEGAESPGQADYYRYQTGPDDAPKILKECKALQQIVNLAHIEINKQVKGYVPFKVSLLYSRPKGKPQGFHIDDYRSEAICKRDGPFLSVIVALQNGTTLDLKNKNNERDTYSFPKGTLVVFDGRLMHGGSAYKSHNLRVHIYFKYKGDTEERKGGDGGEDIDINHDGEDSVALLYRCPVKGCDHCKRKINFTYEDIYNHWRDYHRDQEKMSLKVYKACLDPDSYWEECDVCKKAFFTRDRLENHVWKEHGGPRPVYGCPECEKWYFKPDSLENHLKKRHGWYKH